MKKNPQLDKTLCLNFCSYYKPGKNEELACRGYEVVERLSRAGKPVSCGKSGAKSSAEQVELIVQRLCSACGFQKDGCDFMLDRKAPPCGGFVLLAQLLDAGVISMDDLI